ncbi:MAG TPA: tetratricopeptide repeat protein [Desulfatiglandales bacterium]|nr:tetratricopeptide repeat protein [Desulfatiglandales bacterium]
MKIGVGCTIRPAQNKTGCADPICLGQQADGRMVSNFMGSSLKRSSRLLKNLAKLRTGFGSAWNSAPGSIREKSVGILMFLLLFLCPIALYAGQERVLDPKSQFQFAEQYFEKGEHYRAIGEYERFIYFFPDSPQVELVKYRIGLSYLKGERYEQAIEVFQALIEEYKDTEYAFQSYLGTSKAYVLLGRYDTALTSLNNLITIAPDQKIRDEAYYRKGWVYLEMGLWERAREHFEEISDQEKDRYHIENLMHEIDTKMPLKQKNPTAAGVLAIVPGAGHLYCERPRDALISFLLNGAMIYAAYEAFDEDLDALGFVIAFFELGFYTGNIYSAVSSAHKYNRDEKKRFLNHLRERTGMTFSLAKPHGCKSLMLTWRFAF